MKLHSIPPSRNTQSFTSFTKALQLIWPQHQLFFLHLEQCNGLSYQLEDPGSLGSCNCPLCARHSRYEHNYFQHQNQLVNLHFFFLPLLSLITYFLMLQKFSFFFFFQLSYNSMIEFIIIFINPENFLSLHTFFFLKMNDLRFVFVSFGV